MKEHKRATGPKIETVNPKQFFRPGTRIELIFDVDLDRPIVRDGLLYDCQYADKQLVVSQTRPEILPSFRFTTLDVTTLIEKELGQRSRVGLRCTIKDFQSGYELSNKTRANAILLAYSPPLKMVNLRSAYRLEPTPTHNVEGVIFFHGNRYVSEDDFRIQNISFNGVGLIIPRLINGQPNGLLEFEAGDEFRMEIHLKDAETGPRVEVVPVETLVVRKIETFNRTSGFLGAHFSSLDRVDEEKISKFIHRAQLYGIRNG